MWPIGTGISSLIICQAIICASLVCINLASAQIYAVFFLIVIYLVLVPVLVVETLDFIACALVIIYVGAIAIFLIFLIMSCDLRRIEKQPVRFFADTTISSSTALRAVTGTLSRVIPLTILFTLCSFFLTLFLPETSGQILPGALYSLGGAELLPTQPINFAQTASTQLPLENIRIIGLVMTLEYPISLLALGFILFLSMIGAVRIIQVEEKTPE